ncbi:hypothetical protein ACLKA6_004736 [Drosophila palustris]
MSDFEDMDNDRLNELESILYASIHYNDTTSEEQQQHALGAALDAQSMPPPSQQQQQHRIVSEKRIINNATAKPRYWAETKSEAATTTVETAKPKTSQVTPAEGHTMTQHWVLRLMKTHSRAFCNQLSEVNHGFIVLLTLKLLCIVTLMDYYYLYYGHDLLYWLDEISQHPLEWIFSVIVLATTLHVLMSSVEVIIFESLIRRNTCRYNKPRQYFEERYRRFVIMRLVQQLENALQMQKRYTEQGQIRQDMAMLEDLLLFHQQIHQAVNDFRSSVAVLLWPDRADLQMDAYVLYHIDEAQLDELLNQGYNLNKPDSSAISTTTEESIQEQPKRMLPPKAAETTTSQNTKRIEANNPKKHTKPLNTVQQKLLLQQQQQKKKQIQQSPKKQQKPPNPQTTSKATTVDEPEQFDQRLLVAIPHNLKQFKREPAQRGDAPFGKANRKLEQLQKLAQKRQKSKRVQINKKLRPSKEEEPVEFVDLVDSEASSNADDVIIVPLPPVPIINVDASDDENEEERQTAQPYLEENAMDAADVRLGIDCTMESETVPSSLTSPCNSVLSSDDFIVQKDTSRFLADQARATDEDLLVLTENAIRDAAEPDSQAEREQAPDTSSEHEFVPPSKLDQIKQNFRVDEQQFRALDVYESESDLTESGIYCKAKQKATPTVIRSVDSDSDITDVEAVVEDNVVKTKRLRKRRASSTNQSQSDPNNELDMEDDTDSDNDVEATGVPGIARGMAVERVKRKIKRINQRRGSEGGVVTSKSPKRAAEAASSESGTEESLPTARQIAERLLKQEQANEQATEQPKDATRDVVMESEGSDANTDDEAEMNNAMTERISAVFKRIDGNTERSKRQQNFLDNSEQDAVSTTDTQQEMETDNTEEQDVTVVETEADTFDSEPQVELQPEPEDESVVQVEHNMSELKEQLTGGDLVGWNDEMCRFYNDSWHGEQFNMQKLLKSMSGQRHEWRIINADRFPVVRKRSNLKCTNCFEMGHMRSKCPRPRKPVICYTCGMTGHAEPRCPNAICLGCGAKQALYVQKCNKCSFHSRMVCQLCKMRGHSTDMCPDKWRRYHSTIRSNELLDSNVQYRPKNCSYCSARGHLFEECRQRIGEYRSTNYSSFIMSHQKVYKDRSGPVSYLSDMSSFFAIETPFHFNWSSEFSKNSCYARFLKAVGLARPQEKQIKSMATTQVKMYTNDYVPNPLARAARVKRTATSTVITEESPAKDNVESEAVAAATETEVATPESQQQEEMVIDSQSKPLQATSTPKFSINVAPAVSKSSITPHDLDSDSNYSFSEHFEVPSSTTTTNTVETTVHGQRKSRPMEDLPDVIPLSTADDDGNDDFSMINHSQGISMCVTSKATSTSTSTSIAAQSESLPDLPSEAKILMAHDQTQYLFSPEGRQFLTTSAKQCNVSVRMDFEEYGYVLVIYGLKKNQEDLQLMLLHRNQEVRRKTSEFQRQKPPKRIDVLIRFMRDGIYNLTGDLGNAKNLYFRIKELEEMNTRNGFKLAERKRRQLNMILFGQAGLANGSMHLDQLLVILKRLVEEHSPDGNAPQALRNEIEEHWHVIFGPLPHADYESLLKTYSKLEVKNRMNTLNIEPTVLGLQSTRKSQPAQKRDHIASPPPPPPVWPHEATTTTTTTTTTMPANKNKSPKGRALLNGKWADQQTPLPPVWKHEERPQQSQPAVQQQQQQQQINRTPKQRTQTNVKPSNQQQRQLPMPPIWQHEEQHNNSSNNKVRPARQRSLPYARPTGQQQQHPHQQQQQLLPCNNMQQRTPAKLQLHRNRPLQSECVRLLAGMERDSRSSINTDASKPSMFWSRESLKYLDKLFQTTVNPETLERLHRVLDRSRRGQLSHNDYRAVIRLHSIMESN